MWWSRLLVCLMVLGLGPAGCGFQPIYARQGGESSAVAEELASVQIGGISDRVGQQLRNSLVLSLSPRGEAVRARYRLEVNLSQSLRGLANSRDGNASVGETSITALYTLYDIKAGGAIYSGTASAFSSYRYQDVRYGSTVSEREAETAAVNEVATEIRGALATFFADRGTFATRYKERAVVPYQTGGGSSGNPRETP
jgi:LPS-assembly lipoprotein